MRKCRVWKLKLRISNGFNKEIKLKHIQRKNLARGGGVGVAEGSGL